MKIKNIVNEFAPANNPSGGNYLKALASAWYNDTFNTGDLHKGIKSQEDVERILERGIHCGDGKIRKYSIGYNSDFDGVEIQSEDHYEYSDYDDAGRDIDSRTGQPWGPYDVVAFGGNELDESVAEGEVVAFPKKHKGDLDSVNDCPKCGGDLQGGKYMGHEVKVCMPCKQVYLPPNSGIDQQGNPIKEVGVAEGLEDSNIQSAIVDTVERLFRKNEISDYNALEAIRQGVKHHFSKPGATIESALDGILNILDKRMHKSGNYVDLSRFKEALRQGVAHQLKKQGVAEGEHEFKSANGPVSVTTEPGRTVVKRKEWDNSGSGSGSDSGTLNAPALGGTRKSDYDSGDYSDERSMDEAEQQKGADYRDPPEADYGDDYQAMVKRMKQLAGAGPLKTQYDPTKRVYKNMPTATQPGAKK